MRRILPAATAAVAACAAIILLFAACAGVPAKSADQLSATQASPAAAQSPAPQTTVPAAAKSTVPPAAQSPQTTGSAVAQASAAPPLPTDVLALYAAAGPEFTATLERAIALASIGKWRASFDVLSAFDPKNLNPWALAAETRLILEGYIRSDMHRSFALKNLAEGEDLMALRAANEEGDLFAFDPQALLDAQEKANIQSPAVLLKEFGDYFYDVQSRWSGQWDQPDEAIYEKSLGYYEKAYAGGAFDAGSLQNYAEILLRLDRAAEAEPLFAKSVSLDSGNASSAYNYAVCLLTIGKVELGLDELDRALALMPADKDRLDAISTGARAAASAGEKARAESYLAMADALMPDDPSPGLLRQFIAIEQGDSEAASKAGDSLMQKYSASPGVIRALVSAWYKAGKLDDARVFLEHAISSRSDDESLGALKIYLAILFVQGEPGPGDQTKALDLLSQAEVHMKKVLPADSDVFQAIDGIRAQIEAMTQASSQESAAPSQGTAPAQK